MPRSITRTLKKADRKAFTTPNHKGSPHRAALFLIPVPLRTLHLHGGPWCITWAIHAVGGQSIKRKFTCIILPALALASVLSGCDISWGSDVSGVPLAELDTGGDAPLQIALVGPDNVVITEGKSLSITLDGDAKAGEALRFDRDGDRLTVGRDTKIWDGSGTAIVRITMPAPENLAIAGSGSIKSDAVASKAGIEIAGSGDVDVRKVAAEMLTVEIAGSGGVKAAGTAKQLRVEVVGNGDVALEKLVAEDVGIEITGAGDVSLASDGMVDVEIAGSGNVIVVGDAKCSVETAGSGTVTCRPAAKRTKSAAAEE